MAFNDQVPLADATSLLKKLDRCTIMLSEMNPPVLSLHCTGMFCRCIAQPR